MTQLRKITAVWTGVPGLPGTSTMYFDSTALSLGDQLDGLDEFWNGVVTMDGTATGGLDSRLTISLDTDVPVIDVATGSIVDFQSISEPHTYSGNGGGEPLPPATQMLIEWTSGSVIAGRKARGRTFIGCLTQDHNDSGVPTDAAVTALQNFASPLSLEAMGLYSPTHHQSVGASGARIYPEFAVLRSRRD